MQEIPKLFTAAAEWSSCVVFAVLLKNRFSRGKTAGILAGFLLAFCMLQTGIGIWPVELWIPAMAVAMALMYLCIFVSCEISALDAGLCWAMSFLTAEFVASFEWQIWSFLKNTFLTGRFMWSMESGSVVPVSGSSWVEYVFMIFFYFLLFGCFYLIQKKFISEEQNFSVTGRELLGCLLMTIMVFLMSNISYVYPNTPFSTKMQGELFYIRTLVDFSGVLILFTQQRRFAENRLKTELTTMSMLMNRQYEQYQLSKNNIELLNHKYHDLKHQIAVIKAEDDEEKRAGYLEEMEMGLKLYEAQNKTGNKVLDTILTGKSMYCVQKKIEFTCVADGTLLEFMDTMDICSIFGNALDNAIESSEKVQDPSKRLIRVALYAQNRFVIIRFENYFEEKFDLEERNGIRLPVTTKKDKAYHGFGIRSIQNAAEKYGGTMTVETDGNWFYLRILIPQKGMA